MKHHAHTIERLTSPVNDADVRALTALLLDAVDSGAAVSFVQPLTPEEADRWWRKTLESLPRADAPARSLVVLVARETATGEIVGSVQLHPAWAPNQPHRGDIAKLLVHRRSRRAGLGKSLMLAAEDAARQMGLTLLTLDARRGAAAVELYKQMNWIQVGIIPQFAVDADGKGLHDTVIFYKELK